MPPYDLDRFLQAQSTTYDQAHAELAAGQKRTHWMWFIFPQIAGLGSSPTARRYAIASLGEAQAYLAHPTLGPRLRTVTALVNAAHPRSLANIFGYPDDLKFHSSVTLFSRAAGLGPDPASSEEEHVFTQALDLFFAGRPDPATLRLLEP